MGHYIALPIVYIPHCRIVIGPYMIAATAPILSDVAAIQCRLSGVQEMCTSEIANRD